MQPELAHCKRRATLVSHGGQGDGLVGHLADHAPSKGSANTEIATALHVSVRTIESHLSMTFAKLGVADRRQLAAALGHGEG